MPVPDFTTVYTDSDETTIHLLKHALERSGLTPIVADEHFARNYRHYGSTVASIRVMVPSEDVAPAREVIREVQGDPVKAPGSTSPPCLECGGRRTRRPDIPLIREILTLLLLGLPGLFRRKWQCEDCGAVWSIR